ncbi:E3 ubiquitin-protein ligase TRIM45 [Entelurus aequoreus]|uniref:E3 ubiquitin-protein ligase TRIM45 n=1 Tax=Entelurus aequoreus TaxID=161455 RepID=UPI002B1DE569|nr:E3 ubiquitin-protein ligase TRIM45 [Entelurus aequoreus]
MSASTKEGGEVSETPRAVCKVCGGLYREPRILPCLHTFCLDCISQLEPFSGGAPRRHRGGPNDDHESDGGAERAEKGSVTVLCPQCDSEVQLPPSGPAGLSIDHLALDEVFLETLVNDGPLGCDLCGETGAESRCDVCSVNLCEFCNQAHRRQKRTASHSIQRLEDLKSRGGLCRPVLCSLHPGQELRLFCQPCDLPVCPECAATLHCEHRCCPAHEVVNRHGDRIRALVSDSLRPRLELLEQTLQKVDLSQEALQERFEATANEVKAFARGYAHAVETHCLSLMRRLEELRLQHRNQLLLQRAQCQQALCDVRGGVAYAEKLLSRGSHAEILSAKNVTLRRLSFLAEPSRDPRLAALVLDDGGGIRFDGREAAGEAGGFPLVGVVHHTMADPHKCRVEGEGLQQVWEGQQGDFRLLCCDAAGQTVARGGDHVLVSILHRDRKNCTVDARVLDNEDGSYTVSYTPQEAGLYSVWVCVRAQHVKGSPFLLSVQKKLRRHAGTFHCCSFCSSQGAKEARCACPGTMPGGFQGCGHSHKGHPGKPHWSCCGNTLEKSECLPASVLNAVSAGSRLKTVEL